MRGKPAPVHRKPRYLEQTRRLSQSLWTTQRAKSMALSLLVQVILARSFGFLTSGATLVIGASINHYLLLRDCNGEQLTWGDFRERGRGSKARGKRVWSNSEFESLCIGPCKPWHICWSLGKLLMIALLLTFVVQIRRRPVSIDLSHGLYPHYRFILKQQNKL